MKSLVPGCVALSLLSGSFSCANAQQSTKETVEVQRVPDNGLQPQIVAEGTKVHLLYYKGDPRAGDLFYKRSDDAGKTFGAPLRVNSQEGSAIAMGTIRGGQLAVGRNGRVFVAWNGSGQAQPKSDAPQSDRKFGTSPFLYTRLKEDGSGFEAQRNAMTRTFNLDGGGSVAADAEGNVYLVWHAADKEGQGEGGRRVWMAHSDDDGATFSKETPVWNEPTGVCGCCQLKVWADAGKKVQVLYRSATDQVNRDTYLLNSEDGGQTFNGAQVHPWKINACPMSSYSFARNGNVLLAAWESERQIFWSPLRNTVADKIVGAPGQGDNRKYPVLATNARGEILLAWTENTAWARGGKVKWQLFDAARRPLSAGERPGLPAWSMVSVFARPDGHFAVMY